MSPKSATRSTADYLAAVEAELDREVSDTEAAEVWQAYLRGVSVQETVAKIRGNDANR